MWASSKPFAGSRYHAALWMLVALALVAGCEQSGQQQEATRKAEWPRTAIVADLADRPDTEQTLPGVKAAGFDTVLFDAGAEPNSSLQQRLDAAKQQQLHTLVRLEAAEADRLLTPRETTGLPGQQLPRADGLVLKLERPADLDMARQLRKALQQKRPGTMLIAQVASGNAAEGLPPTTPGGLFDAVIHSDASADMLSLLGSEDTLSPSTFAARHQPSHQPGHQDITEDNRWTRWHYLSHCRPAHGRQCSEDLRLLVMGFTQAPVPVTGVIEGPFWQGIYRSLIQLRRDTPLIHEGKMEWYAVDDQAGVVAYRLTNDQQQHVLVAINVSDQHHELPLPFGFMADSKIRLWASYAPETRELVTSKPVALPARSAVVVIRD